MKDRFISAVIVVGLALMLAAFSGFPLVMKIIIALLSAAALWEILFVSGWITRPSVMVLAMVVSAVWPFLPPFFTDSNIKIVFVALVALCAAVLSVVRQIAPVKMLAVTCAIVLVPMFFTTLCRLREMEAGILWYYTVFVCAWASDMGGYCVGRLYGRRKLVPRISPNKTVEGLVGCFIFGLAGMLIVAFFGRVLTPYRVNYVSMMVCSVLGAAVGVCGDLCASAVKRYFGVKDYGHLLPGHGGIMDRFDSVLFCAPALYVYSLVTTFLWDRFGLDWMVFRL